MTMEKNLIQSIVNDRAVRQSLARKHNKMFFSIYFPHYITYELAPFHHEIFDILQDFKNKLSCIVSFRGSGKSTIITMSYSIWSILGDQKKKFVLILCRTQAQAILHMSNLKQELETNDLLKSDLGPFREDRDTQWAATSLVFPSIDARITIASLEQSVRGIRHRQHRPDLIILDDIEDVTSVKTYESRNKTFDWFTREIIPLGDTKTRVIIVGNLLHDDSLVMRIKRKIQNNEISGIYREYPLVTDTDICLWPGKFPNSESLQVFKRSIISDIAWKREYLLQIINEDTQVIYPEWIQYYEELPQLKPLHVFASIDPAISQSSQSDYTAIVCVAVYEIQGKMMYYILPNIINSKLNFPDTLATIQALNISLRIYHPKPTFIIEVVAYQRALFDMVKEFKINCEEFKVISDKFARLSTISHRVQDGSVKFPRKGAEKLIMQLVGFGSEAHDDLVDAFSMGIHRATHEHPFLAILWG
jgi:predicted phage terminase large subunit-like protein